MDRCVSVGVALRRRAPAVRDREAHRGVPDAGLTDPPQRRRGDGGRGVRAVVSVQRRACQTLRRLPWRSPHVTCKRTEAGGRQGAPAASRRARADYFRDECGQPQRLEAAQESLHLPAPSEAKGPTGRSLPDPGRAHRSRTGPARPSIHLRNDDERKPLPFADQTQLP